ncbi:MULTISPECIES: hypothetical protein [unclassified Mycolicibacterium]|uniref:hypothetical protein n=1 Tax=unclassified Mycolicibacterium TaxID=2636767 RepID=UPI0012DDEA4F|nr:MULTISPECIES: hypothetical protein [unclassified Mycolicibacterium]MUL85738.1 hypothetical protein [Mycolicibacterium sp. CBMA 329]MUL91615.1 hypothetical protein [Mycolicibacterium sp. CBMA 331]MUM02146.1 hypothetical protein [Mycolicibacterium sp. CBMA 334]MUM28834.1 hypothetical protein [Mycolicibacterium sp. CBMA 295]MUM41095.1 hypothetical protein [Mycolicibacterium sp. CBMA 247]
MLTRSRVEGWTTGYLISASLGWERAATIIDEHYRKAQSTVGSVPWSGPASDRANDKLSENMAKVQGSLDLMRQAAGIAKSGAESIDTTKGDAVNAIKEAEDQFFSVSEDLTVSDRLPWIISPALALMRKMIAAHAQADIRAKATVLEWTDQKVADQLDAMSAKLREFDLEGGKGGIPDTTGKAGAPQITGLPGPLRPESKAADLNSTLPGTGIEISGDGRTGYPTLNGQRNPLEIEANRDGEDKVRPLPTGTIVGPDGKQYALYSEVPYNGPDNKPNPEYATADTTVVDLANPSKRIDVLSGISQASGVYDPKTNRMIIVGNTGPHPGDRTRMLYMSEPINPADPDGWINTLKPQGVIQGLPGDRESQLVALKGGGFMLAGSDNFNKGVPDDQPIGAVTASTPEGLLNAKAVPLFPPGSGWPGGAAPYGPTVVDTVYDPVTGVETVQLRVSTWERPPDWNGKGDMPYNPQTYRTEIAVQH